MAYEPKVTGLSPMTGPPGTKITVRGENLGQSSKDIVGLTVNSADCLCYLEWKSPTKIITRCTKVLGSGDIIVSTKSGGTGTCDVQFNCYEETVGPNDESAVWVDEIDHQVPEKEKTNVSSSNSRFSSSKFKPQIYLNSEHSNSSLYELAPLLESLPKKSVNSDDTDLLRSDLPVIMECLQILEHSSITSRDSSIDNIVKSIRQSLVKTKNLFDPLLKQKDVISSLETAMQELKTISPNIFALPEAIESAIRTKEYDMVVKEISAVLPQFETVAKNDLAEKLKAQIKSQVEKLKATIQDQLHQDCTSAKRNIEEVRRLIGHLHRLGATLDVWQVLEEMFNYLNNALADLSVNQTKLNSQEEFVEQTLKVFNSTYYDILILGNCYFDPKDEISVYEVPDKQARQGQFKLMTSQPIQKLLDTLKEVLIDRPYNPETSSLRKTLEAILDSFRRLTKVVSSLRELDEFVIDIRKKSIEIIFENSTKTIKNPASIKDNQTDIREMFEKNVIATLKDLDEIVIKTRLAHEQSILKIYPVRALMKGLAQSLVNSYIDCLNNSLKVKKSQDYTDALLVAICNCQFARDHIFARLKDEFEKFQGLEMDNVFQSCSKKYGDFIREKSSEFCHNKCKELLRKYKEDDEFMKAENLQINLMKINSHIYLEAPHLVNDLMISVVNYMCDAAK